MKENHKALFQPIKIGTCEIKNRYAMAPMGSFGFVDQEGILNDLGVEYYAARARGGIGLIQTGMTVVENDFEKANPTLLFLTKDTDKWHSMQQFNKLTSKVHAFGSKVFLQLSAGWGRSSKIPALVQGAVAPSPVSNRYNPNIMHRELTTEEVEQYIRAFGAAAAFAKHCGFDGVEIHALHEGYLLDRFATEAFNQRTDRFGGSFENRYRFATEIVETIKKYCGKDFPVTMRFSPKHYMKAPRVGAIEGEVFEEYGRDMDEGIRAAKLLEAAGYDALDVDLGCYDAHYWNHPSVYQKDGLYLDAASKIKEAVNIPVIVAGRMDNPDMGAEAIEKGLCDMVSLGRPSLADPDLPNKVQKGCPERVRRCISCNIGCSLNVLNSARISCTVNAVTGNELDPPMAPALEKKNIVVIGGGPAGAEFARVAASRGHKITLFDKNDRIGGNLLVASKPEFKTHDEELANWFANELNIAGVDVKLNTEANIDTVKACNPDVVIAALGAKPFVPPIKGVEHSITAEEALMDIESVGKKVTVIGGGQVGAETALWLAQRGHEVTIVEALPNFMPSALETDIVCAENMLRFYNAEILLATKVEDITEKSVTITNENGTTVLESDTTIMATGYRANNAFVKELQENFNFVYNIGDSVKARNIYAAIHEAYELAKYI